MKIAGKKDNRGGARPNSGPKPQTVSQKQILEARAAAERLADEHGKNMWEVCGEWIYDEGLPIDRRQAAWKLFMDKATIQVSEGGEADRNLGPAFYLPEKRPALEAIEGGKTA